MMRAGKRPNAAGQSGTKRPASVAGSCHWTRILSSAPVQHAAPISHAMPHGREGTNGVNTESPSQRECDLLVDEVGLFFLNCSCHVIPRSDEDARWWMRWASSSSTAPAMLFREATKMPAGGGLAATAETASFLAFAPFGSFSKKTGGGFWKKHGYTLRYTKE
jgi:hypothetical protein